MTATPTTNVGIITVELPEPFIPDGAGSTGPPSNPARGSVAGRDGTTVCGVRDIAAPWCGRLVMNAELFRPGAPMPIGRKNDSPPPYLLRPHGHCGVLVAINGLCGVGKTTVAGRIAARLSEAGVPVVATGQPSPGPMGALARSSTYALAGLPLSLLMAADRYHHQQVTVEPALAAGSVVVCDRYVPTALALDRLDGADPVFIAQIYRHLLRPDLAVLLTGDPAVCRRPAQQRGTYSRFHDGGQDAGVAEAAFYADAGRCCRRPGIRSRPSTPAPGPSRRSPTW